MLDTGLSAEEASAGVHTAMIDFAGWYSRIDVPQQTHDTSKQLIEKWPLAMIINGNAQLGLSGLGHYFELILHAGPRGRSKPFSDVYFLTTERLDMPIGETLHIGDDFIIDVSGAIHSGTRACWIRPEDGDLVQIQGGRLLPHLEIS